MVKCIESYDMIAVYVHDPVASAANSSSAVHMAAWPDHGSEREHGKGDTFSGVSHGVLICRDSYDMDAVYVHDPAALAAVLQPSLFTWRPGQIRVLTESVARGMSVMDTGLKRWNRPHSWTDRPKVQVRTLLLVGTPIMITHSNAVRNMRSYCEL